MASKLLEYTYGDINLFCSKDMKEERGLNGILDTETATFSIIRNFLELNKEYKELTEAYAKKNNLERIAILMAHGDEICNPGRKDIKSKMSPILMPNETYSGLLLDAGRVQIEFFLPGTGYVDSYMIEEELKKLEN